MLHVVPRFVCHGAGEHGRENAGRRPLGIAQPFVDHDLAGSCYRRGGRAGDSASSLASLSRHWAGARSHSYLLWYAAPSQRRKFAVTAEAQSLSQPSCSTPCWADSAQQTMTRIDIITAWRPDGTLQRRVLYGLTTKWSEGNWTCRAGRARLPPAPKLCLAAFLVAPADQAFVCWPGRSTAAPSMVTTASRFHP